MKLGEKKAAGRLCPICRELKEGTSGEINTGK